VHAEPTVQSGWKKARFAASAADGIAHAPGRRKGASGTTVVPGVRPGPARTKPDRHGAGVPDVSLADVSFAYRRGREVRSALASISLQVPRGQFLALVGANGTGKSTLLRIVAGLLLTDTGSVEISGVPLSGPIAQVGIVFQEPRLLPWRTTLENVAFPLELAGWPAEARERRAVEVLRLVGLPDADALRPHQLSGGMRQRAAIARALVMQPAVLLLDEPFSALDALTRERFNSELGTIWRETGATVLLVTHSIAEALQLADRVVVLAGHPGRIVDDVEVRTPAKSAPAEGDGAYLALASRIRSALDRPGDVDGVEGSP
jgi:NitT/TauT family transport system ATP-binding protein